MTTFSPRKESGTNDGHPSLTDSKFQPKERLSELSKRLINVMLKLGMNVQKYRFEECTIGALKDMVYDIQMQVEEVMNKNVQFNLTRAPESGRQSSPHYMSQLGGERIPYHGRGMAGAPTDTSGHFGIDVDLATDISNFRGNSGERKHSGERNTDFEIRNQFLEEKEKRLNIQETLTRTKEEKLQYKNEIEALRTELRKRPLMSTNDRKAVT